MPAGHNIHYIDELIVITMQKKDIKSPYIPPMLTIYEYEVEHGFALSKEAHVQEEFSEFTGAGGFGDDPFNPSSGSGGGNGEYEEGLWY